MTRPTHRRLGSIARTAQWGWPWLATLALSAGLTSAVTVALAGAPASGPDPSGPPGPSAATAALADGDDVQARFLLGLYGRGGSDACETSGSRRQYAGLNSWIVLEPAVTSCPDGGS